MGLLDGKVAVITGAGHGVGRGYALAMADEGANVVVNDLGGSARGEGTDARAADEVVEVITKRGGRAVANYEDVGDFAGAGRMIRQAVDTFGQLDILVNNAGILRDKMIFSMEESDWDAVLHVHLKGHFAPTRHAAAYWRDKYKQQGEDRPLGAAVINTTSAVGLVGNTSQSNYTAAKGGIAMFTIAVALELERYGIRVNCIAPSGTTRLIGLAAAARSGEEPQAKEPDEYEEEDPSSPGNVAPLAVWLASDLSAHVTGQVFMSVGFTVTHFQPWTPRGEVTAQNAAKWDPAELGKAIDLELFGSRPSGLRGLFGTRTRTR